MGRFVSMFVQNTGLLLFFGSFSLSRFCLCLQKLDFKPLEEQPTPEVKRQLMGFCLFMDQYGRLVSDIGEQITKTVAERCETYLEWPVRFPLWQIALHCLCVCFFILYISVTDVCVCVFFQWDTSKKMDALRLSRAMEAVGRTKIGLEEWR